MPHEFPPWVDIVRTRLDRLSSRLSTDSASAERAPDTVASTPTALAPGSGNTFRDSGDAIGRIRFDPGRRGVRVLIGVVIVIALSAGVVAWWGRPRASAVSERPLSEAPASSATTEAILVVAITGKVARPGLVRVPIGSRVADVITAAGGALPDVDFGQLNLARKVADGELVVVGVQALASGQGGAQAGYPGKVNLNSATLAELDALPGVGPVTAQRVIEYRTSHGQFRAVTELRRVEGIGDARFEQLKDLVTV